MKAQRKNLFDLQVPFFRPVWIRVLTVVICVGWGLFEFSTGEILWGILFVAMGVWAGYQFWTWDLSGDTNNEG